MKLTALSAKQHTTPNRTGSKPRGSTGKRSMARNSSPVRAGPIARAELNSSEFSPTALMKSSRGTRSGTNASRAA